MTLHKIESLAELNKYLDFWSKQCEKFGETIDDYAPASLEHARSIVSNGAVGQPEYSVYAALIDGSCECILHVNLARLPGTEGVTQKVMSVTLAPDYDYQDVENEKIASVATTVVFGAYELCKKENKAQYVKIHIANLSDREFFSGAAQMLKVIKGLRDVGLKGNWLHLTIDK